MQFVNQFSFLLLAGAVLLGLGWVILRSQRSSSRWFALVALLLGLVISYWMFNPGPGTSFNAAELNNGRNLAVPVLLEFESPYCLGCMAAQPSVDQVKRQYADKLAVHQVNVLDPAAEPLLAHFGFQFTPTFIFIDIHGIELWRSVGTLDPQQVGQSMEGES
jgi:thiol-disulfide isomerase/thioredoxin